MGTEENKAIVRRYVEEILVRGDVAAADGLLAADYVAHLTESQEVQTGLDTLKERIVRRHEAFPDLGYRIEDMIAEGDRVVVIVAITGTHQGETWSPLGDIPPTQQQVTIPAAMVYRVAGGKITDMRDYYDRFSLYRQLGAIPTPAHLGRWTEEAVGPDRGQDVLVAHG